MGTLNSTLSRFDVIMATDYGTTYNSYLVCDEKVAILDASYQRFTDPFLGKVRAQVDPAKVDYIVVHHTEPDHTGTLGPLLELRPNARVVSVRIGAKWLKEMLNRDFDRALTALLANGSRVSVLGQHELTETGGVRCPRLFLCSPFGRTQVGMAGADSEGNGVCG